MSSFLQFTGGIGATVGDVKYKALTDLAVTFETVSGQEWLRAGWTVPWDAKYTEAHAQYGRGMYGYNIAEVGGASFIVQTSGLIATVHWDGTRFYLFTHATGGSAPAVTTFSAVGGALTVQTHTNIAGAHRVDDLAVSNTGRQVAAVNNGATANVAIAQRDNLGVWAPRLTVATGIATVACNPGGTLWLFASGNINNAGSMYSSTDGITWTIRNPAGTGAASNNLRKLHWSARLNRFLGFYTSTTGVLGTTDGVTVTMEALGGGIPLDPAGRACFAESGTAAIFVGQNAAAVRCLYRSTGGAWSEVALPAPLTAAGEVPSIAFAGGSFFLQSRGGLWRSTDDGLTFTFHGYAVGHTVGAPDWLGAANGQLFRAVNAATTTIQYFSQPALAASPERLGPRFAITTPLGAGAADIGYGFVRIF
jgi:hypothetical protein